MLPELGSRLYHALLGPAARLGHSKARAWVEGRRNLWDRTEAFIARRQPGQKLIWLHAASLGEFEQGAPVFSALRRHFPQDLLVLTFYSPSGYRARHDHPEADFVGYLPADTPRAARRWAKTLRPDLAIFVKYDFWPYHLAALDRAGVPLALIAGSFRAGQPFFRGWGRGWRRMLNRFNRLVVQRPTDRELLAKIGLGLPRVLVGGDPRVDRVADLASSDFTDPKIQAFIGRRKCLLAGSVWPQDVALFAELLDANWPEDWCLVLAPHQLKEGELREWAKQLNALRYQRILTSEVASPAMSRVLLLDVIGILSRAYRYADLAYVGGGFGAGVHNTLEPMAYGLPVVFGPRHQKFPEAVATVASGGSFCVESAADLRMVFTDLQGEEARRVASSHIRSYLTEQAGATQRTLGTLLELLDS